MKNVKNYYEILEINPNTSNEVIKMAYKALVRKYHPDTTDKSNQEEYTKKIKEINEAYETLSNPQKRTQYDYTIGNIYNSSNYSENVNYESKQSSTENNNIMYEEENPIKKNKDNSRSFKIASISTIIIFIFLFSMYNKEFFIGNDDKNINQLDDIQQATSYNSTNIKQPEVTKATTNKQPSKTYCPGAQKCFGAPICPGGKNVDCPGGTTKICTEGHACSHGNYGSHTYINGTETLTCNEAKACIHGFHFTHDDTENCKHGYSFPHTYVEYCEHGYSFEHRVGTCEHAFTFDHMEPCEHGEYDPHYY